MPRNLCIEPPPGAAPRLAAALVALTLAAAPSAAQESMPLDEVTRGQRGYGLSVFQGDAPERFEVEVLGVWRNVLPETSYILARLTGQGLEQSGVIAGMSGSPVYLDDRLAGAVAFAWPFAHEAIAGITPIELMRQLYGGGGDAAPPRGAPAATLGELAAARPPEDLLRRNLTLLRARLLGDAGPGVLWSAVGLGERTRALLGETLGPVAAAGNAAREPGPPVPGGAVAGVLIDGDLRLAATGTVTDRSGDRILAFGHPLLGFGDVRLPMASAEVITVLSSRYNSFKIANLGSVVGAFDLDRNPGIRGRVGAVAPTVPVTIVLEGERRTEFALEIADLPLLTPTLVAIGALSALDAASRSAGSQGLDLTVRYLLAGHGELEMRQSFDGDAAGLESVVYLLGLTGFLVNNAMEEVVVERIQVELRQHPAPRVARLLEAHVASTVVRPGDTVRLHVDLQAYRGARLRKVMELELPRGLPAGRYSLLVGDGVSVDAARLGIERVAPVRFGQVLDLLRGLHSRRQLVALGVFGGRGLTVGGEVLPQLPGSIGSLWRAAPSAGAQPLRLAVAQQEVLALEHPAEGLARVDLEVRRREPLAREAMPPVDGGSGGDRPAAGEPTVATAEEGGG